MNGRIEPFDLKVHLFQTCGQINRDAGMGGQKPRQARRQPSCTEGRQDRQRQGSAIGRRDQFHRGATDQVKRPRHLSPIGLRSIIGQQIVAFPARTGLCPVEPPGFGYVG